MEYTTLTQIEARRDQLLAEARDLADNPTPAATDRLEKIEAEMDDLRKRRAELADAERRAAVLASLSPAPSTVQVMKRDANPWALIEDRAAMTDSRQVRDAALRAVEARIGDLGVYASNAEHLVRMNPEIAKQFLERSSEDYTRAFAKMMRGEGYHLTEAEGRALAVGTNTQGGFLLPTHLDPTIILTNSGTDNPYRRISRVVQLTTGDTWNGVSSAGVTASWDAELAEVSDDAPELAQPSIPVYKGQAFVPVSFEAFEDIANLGTEVVRMFVDAKDRLEGSAFATGSGSSQPTGIFTALDANTNVEITTTTAATVGEVDIHAVYRTVPVRWRGRATWVMHPIWSLEIKRLGTAVSSSYSGDLTMPVTDRILGRPAVESDDAPSTQTTTALDNVLVFGDFSSYVIVDRIGASIEFIPNLFHTSNNRPSGSRGWLMHWRVGADSVSDTSFALLQDKTSA